VDAPERFALVAIGSIPAAAGGSGPLEQPAGIACDAFGRIYVSDAAHHRLQRYDEKGVWLGEAGALGDGEGRLRRPGAIAPVGTLSMAVLDRENRRIVTYDLFGRLQGTLIDLESAELDGELGRIEPVDLAADRGGNLFVVDAERDRVLVFDHSGHYTRTIGGFGARAGSFRGLLGIAAGRRGELFAAERVNARLQRLDPGGRVLASWPLPVKPARLALAVAADDSGRVVVADEAAGTLSVFDADGATLASIAGLAGPRAVAFHRDGSLLVAESGRVRRFRLERSHAPPREP
jgi:sugar lactone lactonase YvrE